MAVKSGANQTFLFTPATGYQVSNVQVDGIPGRSTLQLYLYQCDSQPHYQRLLCTGDDLLHHNRLGRVKRLDFAIRVCGREQRGNQTFTITANSSYHIADVVVDGTHLLAQASPFTYTFSNVKAAHTIAASFGRQVNVNTVAGLYNAFTNQKTGDEIIIATGTYQLNSNTELTVNVNNMYIHSASGNRDDVYIRGDALSAGAAVKVIFNFTQGVYGQYTTLSNMKIGTVGWSAIQMNGDQAASYSLYQQPSYCRLL